MNNNIKSVIIDDEETFSSSLEILLKRNFNNISIIGKATSIKDGISLINKVEPDLVFLDINFPEGNGFQIIESTKNKNYEIIFTTSFSEHAVRAFEVSAIHYLLKPIDIIKLKEALNRYLTKTENEKFDEKLNILKNSLLDKPQKIMLPTSEGNSIFIIGDIVRCIAEGTYSNIYFNDKTNLLISKPLLRLQEIFEGLDFARIHDKHLINLKYVKRYVAGRNPYIVLIDNSEIPISQSKVHDFREKLKSYVKSI